MDAMLTFMLSGVTMTCVRAMSTAGRRVRAPVAKRIPHEVFFGQREEITELCPNSELMSPVRSKIDYYYWLRDDKRKNEGVLEYLQEENEYTKAGLKHVKPLQEELYKQMLSNMKETDENLPYRRDNYFYYSRTVKGMAYAIHCRKEAVSVEQSVLDVAGLPEEVILDENKVAEGLAYCVVDECEPSPSHEKLAYSTDTTGYETYDIMIKDLASGEIIDTIKETSGSVEWAADDSTFFYLKMDEEHRPFQLWLHTIGTDDEDILLFQEDDGKFWMGCGKTNSDDFLVVSSGSPETTECWMMDLRGIKGAAAHRAPHETGEKDFKKKYGAASAVGSTSFTPALLCVQPREMGVRYDVEHHEDSLYMITNKDGAKNGKLMRSKLSWPSGPSSSGRELKDILKFSPVKPYDENVQIESFNPFKNFAVISGRKDGKVMIWRVNMNKPAEWHPITLGRLADGTADECYSAYVAANYNYVATDVRMGFTSFTSPRQVINCDMANGEVEVLWQAETPNYDPTLYESRRIYAPAPDGTKVPMSVLYKKQFSPFEPNSKSQALLLDGYGSYGVCNDPSFSSTRLSLLDRGVVYAVAHIRGGGEMGRHWYEDMGKYLSKLNTFDDFQACAQYLIDEKITSSDQLAAVGRSAGGLLIGATANRAGHLFKALVADVPFVDVMSTMSDPSIPLTTTEWEEWGNPHIAKYFDYMMQYSPIDNVKEGAPYPAMLVTGGLNDPRVAYWEPAKWVAKLRYHAATTEDTDGPAAKPLYLKTDMTSGHFSASDRYKHMREAAFEYAFILDQILPTDGATE